MTRLRRPSCSALVYRYNGIAGLSGVLPPLSSLLRVDRRVVDQLVFNVAVGGQGHRVCTYARQSERRTGKQALFHFHFKNNRRG